ncbi:hypothetical protein [Pseudomonas sp. JG-B]|uniref:hypothetical protein n=1 Tax=Pseudomonas sp. JG-B TaxID=2603214 RepID=UPI00129D40F5|nr:hypothetical protein [Pseudomonas sp. JG-B]MRK19073.1 hypothetical protein [Pseudomonas sp. JG-B]
MKKFPELAGTYAAVSAMQKQAEKDNLTREQQEVVSSRVRENVAKALESGQVPSVKLQERERQREQSPAPSKANERDIER